MAERLKNPLPFVAVSRSAPVSSFLNTTLALGTTAPVGSMTVAANDPLAFWPKAEEGGNIRAAISRPARMRTYSDFCMVPLSGGDRVADALFYRLASLGQRDLQLIMPRSRNGRDGHRRRPGCIRGWDVGVFFNDSAPTEQELYADFRGRAVRP